MKKIACFLIICFLFVESVFAIEHNGWIQENGQYYYYIDGILQRGITKIEGEAYFLGENSGRLIKT